MSHRLEMWKTLRWLALAGIAAAAFYGLVLRPLERAVSGTKESLERGLDRVLGAVTNSDTRIVEGRAETTETTEISELALLEMRMSATRAFRNEGYVLKYLPAGTKTLIVRGQYRVKAGYRLRPGISLRVEHGQPVARFPKAEVLSVELIDFQILSEEDGWLNKVTAEDRATLLRELREQMRVEAARSGMLDTAEATLRTRLRELLGADSVRIEEAVP
jgi:hypothetical protein